MEPKIAASMRPAASATPQGRWPVAAPLYGPRRRQLLGASENDVANIPESQDRNEQLGVDGESIEI